MDIGMFCRHLPASFVVIPCDGQQRHNGTIVLHSIFVVSQRSRAFIDAHGRTLVDHSGRLLNKRIRYACLTFYFTSSKFFYILCVLRKAMDIFLNIALIDPAVFDQLCSNCMSQRSIGTWPWRQVEVCQFKNSGGDTWIYNNDFHSFFFAGGNQRRNNITGIIAVERPAEEKVRPIYICSGGKSGSSFPCHYPRSKAGTGLASIIRRTK